MFLDNKYTKIYYKIIEKVSKREKISIGEVHHIVPKSMGGSNKKDNLVKLTYKEHYICHLLLTKMVDIPKHKRNMLFALRVFGKSSNFFQKTKQETNIFYSNLHLGISKTEEHKKKMRGKRPHVDQKGTNNNAFKGYIMTPYGKFESLTEAASIENVHFSTISYRINNDNFSEYRRVA